MQITEMVVDDTMEMNVRWKAGSQVKISSSVVNNYRNELNKCIKTKTVLNAID